MRQVDKQKEATWVIWRDPEVPDYKTGQLPYLECFGKQSTAPIMGQIDRHEPQRYLPFYVIPPCPNQQYSYFH